MRIRLVVLLAGICLGLTLGASAATARPSSDHRGSRARATAKRHVLARHRLTVRGGGDVNAPDGWNLYVPPHVLKRNGYGTITSVGHGRVSIKIHARWHGAVQITAPLRLSTEVVAHDLGGLWVPEGAHAGQQTVWVTHLSSFSLSGLLTKAKDFLCLTSFDPEDFVGCLALKGLQWAGQEMVGWIVGRVSHSCAAELIAEGLYGRGIGKVPIGALKHALNSGGCLPHANETPTSPQQQQPTQSPPLSTGTGTPPPSTGPPAPTPPPGPSITAVRGGVYGCSVCHTLDIQVHNFPTGTFTYYCHDNSGPGGSDIVFYQHAVSVTDPNQGTWPGVFCYDSAPYVAYLVMDGVRSNSVGF